MKPLLKAFVSTAAVVLLLAASVGAQADILRFLVSMDQAQETSVTTPNPAGMGSGSLFWDDATDLLTWSFDFEFLTGAPTAAHVHTGAAGVAGGVLFGIGAPIPLVPAGNFGTYVGGTALPAPLVNGPILMAGGLYVNIHTAANTGGEIRGQLLFDQVVVPLPGAALLMLSGLGLLGAARHARSA